MEKITFALTTACGDSEQEALLFVKSLRSFAGELSTSPVRVYITEWGFSPTRAHTPRSENLSRAIHKELLSLGVSIELFDVEPEVLQFPFAAKVFAAAAAEEQAADVNHFADSKPARKTEFLAWVDPDTLILSGLDEMVLPPGVVLGCRPVHHVLIGSPIDKLINPFWELVYQGCGVSLNKLFPVLSCLEETPIRPYFNAGLLVTRPERGLLRRWCDTFRRLYRKPDFEEFYQRDVLYRIFIHQAILSGVIASTLDERKIRIFSPRINFPLNLASQYPPERRPEYLDELVTCHYESCDTLRSGAWRKHIPIREPLKSWLTQALE